MNGAANEARAPPLLVGWRDLQTDTSKNFQRNRWLAALLSTLIYLHFRRARTTLNPKE